MKSSIHITRNKKVLIIAIVTAVLLASGAVFVYTRNQSEKGQDLNTTEELSESLPSDERIEEANAIATAAGTIRQDGNDIIVNDNGEDIRLSLGEESKVVKGIDYDVSSLDEIPDGTIANVAYSKEDKIVVTIWYSEE